MAADRAARNSLAAISNALVRLHARHYGKGPRSARTRLYDDFVLALLYEPFTAVERTFVANGEQHRVIEDRLRFYRLLDSEFRETVAQLTGRNVAAFMPQVSVDPPIVSALFLLDEGPDR